MGLVLAFDTAPRPAPSRTSLERRVEPAPSAEILFFTGVRYERAGNPASRPALQPCGGASATTPVS